MANKESFKLFVSKNPNFAKSVSSGKTSWQKLYELYDLYGENNEVWNDYRTEKVTSSTTTEAATTGLSLKGILNSLKGINLESLQENVSSIQKAVGFLEDITREIPKKDDKKKKEKKNLEEIERFYSD
jgi:hypothetical protein